MSSRLRAQAECARLVLAVAHCLGDAVSASSTLWGNGSGVWRVPVIYSHLCVRSRCREAGQRPARKDKLVELGWVSFIRLCSLGAVTVQTLLQTAAHWSSEGLASQPLPA